MSNRKAFTMIELVFVIVILGILAVLAIPKLSATRDDAIVSQKAHSIMSAAFEISSYAIAQGKTEPTLVDMSNAVQTMVNAGEAVDTGNSSVVIKAGGVSNCVSLSVLGFGGNEENLTITFGNNAGDTLCSALQGVIDVGSYPIPLRGQYVTK